MKRRIFCILIFVMPVYADSVQERWVARYNGSAVQEDEHDYVHAMVLDDYGNVYVTGDSWVDGQGYDITTIKYDINGGQLWLRKYDGPAHDNDMGRAIGMDSEGDIYVTGYSYGQGSGQDYVTLKYDGQTGQILWVRRYSEPVSWPKHGWDYANDLAIDHQDNIYVTGFIDAQSNCGTIKYRGSDGHEEWVQSYSINNDWSIGRAVTTDLSGNIFVTGKCINGGNNWDLFVVKYDPNGNEIWDQTYDEAGEAETTNSRQDEGLDLVTDSAGNVFVTGRIFKDKDSQDNVFQDNITLKYLAGGGDPNWVRIYKDEYETGYEETVAIVLDSQENVIVAGTSAVGSTKDFLTIKYSNGGELLWDMIYNGPGNQDDEALDVDTDACDNVYVTGYADFGSGGSQTHEDSITIKYSPLGAERWTAQYNGTAYGDDRGVQVAWHKSGFVYTIHQSPGKYVYDDYVTIQYDQNFQIRLEVPLGGEVLLAEDRFTIDWEVDPDIESVELEFSENNGLSWESLAVVDAEPNQYGWTVPEVDSDECLIRVSQSGNPCLFDVSRPFTVKKILLTCPNGGEAFRVGDSNDITWRWNCEGTDTVSILLSRDGGQIWVLVGTASGGSEGSGSYDLWNITEPSSNQCIMRVQDQIDPNTFDDSDDVFVIYNLHLLTPNGGEQLIANRPYQIQWESDKPLQNVNLGYSANAGGQWESIAENTENHGSYPWRVPDLSSDACLVKVGYVGDPNMEDESDMVFSIRQYQTYPPDPNAYQPLPEDPNDYYWIEPDPNSLPDSNEPNYIAGDYSDDGYQNMTDMALLSFAWGQLIGSDGYNPRIDLNGDLIIGLDELVQFAETWLLCAHPYDPACYRRVWPSCWCRPYQCMGDANGDGLINGVDYSLLDAHKGTKYLESNYWACADFNRDGRIDYRDEEIYDVFIQVNLSGLKNTCRCGGWWPPHVRWYVEQNWEDPFE